MSRFQPRLKPGSRESLGAGVLKAIKRKVQQEADFYDCSKAFVVATILAAHFGVGQQPDYRQPEEDK